jgi:hypothetical protein
MKNKTINTSISLMLLMLIFAVPGHAALPFLQGITNGEVSHIKFAEDESLFVAIKNNSNTILYDQESYPVTSGSLSLMKISSNGNLEWIKDLYTDLQNNLDYDVNVLNGRPGITNIEITANTIILMVSLNSSTIGGKCLIYDDDGNLVQNMSVGIDSYNVRNMALTGDGSPVVLVDRKTTASAGGGTHEYTSPYLCILDLKNASTTYKSDLLGVRKTHYNDSGVLEYAQNIYYINLHSSAVVTDSNNYIYTLSGSEVFTHGADTYTKPTPDKFRNWHLDINDNSVGVFNGGEHDLFYNKTIDYYIYNYPSNTSNKWVGCALYGEFNCGSTFSDHLHWYDQPATFTSNDGHYHRNDGLIYIQKSGSHKFVFNGIDDYVRLYIDGEILLEQHGGSIEITKDLDIGYHWISIEHWEDEVNVGYYIFIYDPNDDKIYQANAYYDKKYDDTISPWYWLEWLPVKNSGIMSGRTMASYASSLSDDPLYTDHLNKLMRTNEAFDPYDSNDPANGGRTVITKRNNSSSNNYEYEDIEILVDEFVLDALFTNEQIYIVSLIKESDAQNGLKLSALNTSLVKINNLEASVEMQGNANYTGSAISFESDAKGNIYLFAYLTSGTTADFKTNGTTSKTISASNDTYFVGKLDSNLNWKWIKTPDKFNGVPRIGRFLGGMSVNPTSGDIYLGSSFKNGELSIISTEGDKSSLSAGSSDYIGFICALSSDGEWSAQANLTVKSDYGSDVITPGTGTFTYLIGTNIDITAPDTIYTDSDGNILYNSDGSLVDEPDHYSAVTRYLCTGYSIGDEIIEGESCSYSFKIEGNTTISFQWETEHILEISSVYEYTEISAAAPNPIPTVGRHWIREGENVTLQVDGVIKDSDDTDKRELLYEVVSEYKAFPADPTQNSIKFNGDNGYVHIPDHQDINTNSTGYSERTIEAWFNVDDKNISDHKQIIYEEGSYLNGLNIYVYNGALYAGIWADPFYYFVSTNQITSNHWHHIALVFDSQQMIAYLDGNSSTFNVAYMVSTIGTLNFHSGDIGIGNLNDGTFFHDNFSISGTGGHYLKGEIDELRIWNTARSASEILQKMKRPLNGNETDLIAYYTFDSKLLTTGTVPDKSANGHHATIVGLNTSTIFETEQLRINLTPKDQRQQPLEFFMKNPVSVTYNWKTQYMIDVNTSSYLYENLPITQSLNGDNSVNKRVTGVNDFWFDKGAKLQLLMRKNYKTKMLNGWLYGVGLPLGTSGAINNLATIVLDDAYTYLYHEIDSLQQGIAITWDMKVLTLYYTASIGDELDLKTIIEANKSSSGGTIDDSTLETLISDLTNNDTLYNSPYNGFIINGPSDVEYESMMLWGEYDQKLFPLIPGKISLEWLVEKLDYSNTDTTTDTANFRVEMTFAFPDKAHYSYVIQSPAVELDRSTDDNWAFVKLAYTDGKNDDGSVTDSRYRAEIDGTRSVLVFTCTDKQILSGNTSSIAIGDTDNEPVCTRVVEAYSLTDVLSDTIENIPIGEVVVDNEHTAPHSGYVYYEKAMVNPNIYDSDNLDGPIIPVNRQFTSDISDDLYIVWYKESDAPIYWPFKAVHYTTRWPELANTEHDENDAQALQRIVVASRLGSDGVNMYGASQFKFDTTRYTDIKLYNQPDKDLPGYNPNEEHAFLEKSLMYLSESPQPIAAYALRKDLNRVTQDETYTSNPYVLVQYFDVTLNDYRMWIFAVEMEDKSEGYTFEYSMKAGELITAPYPLNMVMGVISPSLIWGHDGESNTQRVYWEDHKNQPWAVSGNGSLYAYFWYPMQTDFWWPSDTQLCYNSAVPTNYTARTGDYGNNTAAWTDDQCVSVSPGTMIPYAIKNQDSEGWAEIEVTYHTSWPDDLPILRVGETLTHSGGEAAEDGDSQQGLPGVVAFSSAQIVFDSVNPTLDETQTLSTYAARLAQVLDKRSLAWTANTPFTDLFDATSGEIYLYNGIYFFKDLPAGLQQRIYYDPLNNELVLRGFLDGLTLGDSNLTASPGAIYALQPNILSQAEVKTLKSLNTDSGYQAMIDKLYIFSRDPKEISTDNTAYTVGLKATTNGTQHESALGPGLALMPNDALLDTNNNTLPDIMYVTLAENNHSLLGDAPVALHVIKIEKENRYRGEIGILYPKNAFDEKINLRHTADFGANGDDIVFEWWYREDDGNDQPQPDASDTGIWRFFSDETGNNGLGMNEISLSGAGAALLVDNLFFVRYRHNNCDPDTIDSCWSDWAGAANNNPAKGVYEPQLSEGWVKRVVDRVNLFEARINDFYDNKNPATYSSMIQQVGQRYNGDVALNDDKDVIENVGLIQLYQTVLERAKKLSINASQPYVTSGISVAIQLATSRLAQFYMLLGNEAYTDALDPTIGFSTTSNEYGSLAPSIFSFMDQMPELIDEELALLRGRDEFGASPTFNRLMWNFTMGQGEVAYALSYNISDVDQNGFINEADAATLYPQGHGDAWGHYLMAIRYYYDLLQNQNYNWYSRAEKVSLDGVTVDVDFHDEQCFAEAAAAKAKSGHDIVEMTYRKNYTDDPEGQWQGYKDSNNDRAWGVSQWAERAFTGAYYDWVTANAILPDIDEENTGIQKIDRSTVPDLMEISSLSRAICVMYNQADNGQTPLGVVPGVLPFDIDPIQVDRMYERTATHFEQIYSRAGQALENAFNVFDYANNIKNRIRGVAVSTQEFLEQTYSQDMEYRNRLIELFGSPYEGTIGIGKTYPSGYDGPDLYFYNYIDVNEVSDETMPACSDVLTAMFNSTLSSVVEIKTKDGDSTIEDFENSGVSALYSHFFYNDLSSTNDELANNPLILTNYTNTDVRNTLTIEFPVSASEYSFVAPDDWGIRRSPGEIQDALINLVKAEADLQSSLGAYSSLIGSMEWLVRQMGARSSLNENIVELYNVLQKNTEKYDYEMDIMKSFSRITQSTIEHLNSVKNSKLEGLPKITGMSYDTSAPLRLVISDIFTLSSLSLRSSYVAYESRIDYLESQMELIKLEHAREVVKENYAYDIQQQLKELDELFRKESLARLSVFKEKENMRQLSERYKNVLSKGLRVLEERQIFNQRVASKAQGNRYKDMAFRINHYEALQKYRAAFDMAARYVYLAARAYDYETNLSENDPASVQSLLSKIIKERTLGIMKDNEPMIGFGGLSAIMARMKHNYSVLKSRMGFNNPQTETGRFSLRKELFRIKDDKVYDGTWRDKLSEYRVDDLWEVSEFRRYCRTFAPEAAGPQPGLVIPFSSTIEYGKNFFGWPLSGSDHAYDASNFATKVRSVGVWLENYNNNALAETPRVYLVPAGLDVMYVPDSFEQDTREWDIIDQVIPVPLPVGQSDILQSNWIPMISTINEDPTKIRRYSSFRAYHDNGYFNEKEMSYDSRLVGRSVWNTRWLLIISGATFLNNPDEGLDTLIYGELVPGSTTTRDENGISDIKLFFQTYANSGG